VIPMPKLRCCEYLLEHCLQFWTQKISSFSVDLLSCSSILQAHQQNLSCIIYFS